MRAFLAIVKLTLRNALRSHIFQLLLIALVLCVALIPTTVSVNAGKDLIRVVLLYSLNGVGTLLALSTLWVGCYVMSSDIDDYRLHMVVSKPVSRVTIWFGKFTGVLLLHFALLVLAGAAIYAVVIWRVNHTRFDSDPGEDARIRQQIRDEVLVGRRVFMPERRDYEKLAQKALKKRVEESTRSLSRSEQKRIYKNELDKLIGEDAEVKPGKSRKWIYKGLPAGSKERLYLRYRPYVDKAKSEDQRETRVQLFVEIPREVAGSGRGDNPGSEERFMVPIFHKQTVMSGEFHEVALPGNVGIVSPKGEAAVGVINLDPDHIAESNAFRVSQGLPPEGAATHFYQIADGPMLLIRITSFLGNYARAILVLTMLLVMMTALSCAFGGCLTMPTAVFVSMSYLVFGFMASFMTDKGYYVSTKMDEVGQGVSHWILNVVVPLDNFDVTEIVADGKLVEWSLIGEIALWCLIIRTLPWALGGIYLYWRREIGLEIKK